MTSPRIWLAKNFPDLVALAGVILIVRGVAFWSTAAAFVAAGVLLIGFALLVARLRAE